MIGDRFQHGKAAAAVMLCVLVGLGTMGCGASDPEPPVADSTMAGVLTDLHVHAAHQKLFPATASTAPESLLAAHGLDQRRYTKAVRYYLDHPGAYAALYEAVIERLSAARYPPQAAADTAGATDPAPPAATDGPFRSD